MTPITIHRIEERITGVGTLLSERTGESWTVRYDITYETTLMTVRRGMPAVTHMKTLVRIEHDTKVVFPDGTYSLQTDGEIVHLQKLNGDWDVISLQ